MVTVRRICQEVEMLYRGQHPSDDVDIDLPLIKELVCRNANTLLKVEHINISMPSGDNFPPAALIATYTGLDIEPAGIPAFVIKCNNEKVNSDLEIEIEELEDKYTIYLRATAAQQIHDYIESCPTMSYVMFKGLPVEVPHAFLRHGITELTIDNNVITFCYDPNSDVNYESWITEEGVAWWTNEDQSWVGDGGESYDTGEWTTQDGFSWDTSDNQAWVSEILNNAEIPDIKRFTSATKTLLEKIEGTETFRGLNVDLISCCKVTSNLDELDVKVKLPAVPIHLPHGLGIWRVYKTGQPSQPFIPVQSSQYALANQVGHTNLKSILGNQTCYEYFSVNEIRINKTVPEMGVFKVDMQLLIVDPTKLGWDDLMPIHGDMKEALVTSVVATLLGPGKPDLVNNAEEDQNLAG